MTTNSVVSILKNVSPPDKINILNKIEGQQEDGN